MPDLLQDILDNYNYWHKYQKRLIRRAGSGVSVLPIISKKESDRKAAKVKRELQQASRERKRKREQKCDNERRV